MVILIAGASHTGKTVLAQALIEKYHYACLSIDHLKMGLIRSGNTDLTVFDDDALTDYLWPIVREMVKTAIENHQNLIVEGCYIPFSWREGFAPAYLEQIRYRCLVMTPEYIRDNFQQIVRHASDVEHRLDDSDLNAESLIQENQRNRELCRAYACPMILIDGEYRVSADDF